MIFIAVQVWPWSNLRFIARSISPLSEKLFLRASQIDRIVLLLETTNAGIRYGVYPFGPETKRSVC